MLSMGRTARKKRLFQRHPNATSSNGVSSLSKKYNLTRGGAWLLSYLCIVAGLVVQKEWAGSPDLHQLYHLPVCLTAFNGMMVTYVITSCYLNDE